VNKKDLNLPHGYYNSIQDWVNRSGFKNNQIHRNYPTNKTIFTVTPKTIEDNLHWKFVQEYLKTPPPVSVTVIPNGNVVGSNGAVISPNHKLIWSVSYEFGNNPDTHSIFQYHRLPPVSPLNENVAVLTFSASPYYYHWMYDVLARIYLLRRSKLPYQKLIISPNGSFPFQKETLSMLKIPESRVLTTHNNFHIKAKRLIVPSLVGFTPHMPKWSTDFLRRELLDKRRVPVIKGYERIYISREKANVRKIRNEEQVINTLNKYGFRKVYLEELSVAKQINLFFNAQVIISPHGGGLTNLTFAKPHTKVLELFSPNYIPPLYWVLANHVGLDYYYLIGEGDRPPDYVDPSLLNDDITVNIEQLNQILKKMNL